MEKTLDRAHHRPPTTLEAGLSQSEGEGQQLIGWRLLVCFAIGAALWLGFIELVATGVPGSATWDRIFTAAQLVILFVGVVSLCLAAMARLNQILRRVGPDKGRGPRRGSATSRRSGAQGRLL